MEEEQIPQEGVGNEGSEAASSFVNQGMNIGSNAINGVKKGSDFINNHKNKNNDQEKENNIPEGPQGKKDNGFDNGPKNNEIPKKKEETPNNSGKSLATGNMPKNNKDSSLLKQSDNKLKKARNKLPSRKKSGLGSNQSFGNKNKEANKNTDAGRNPATGIGPKNNVNSNSDTNENKNSENSTDEIKDKGKNIAKKGAKQAGKAVAKGIKKLWRMIPITIKLYILVGAALLLLLLMVLFLLFGGTAALAEIEETTSSDSTNNPSIVAIAEREFNLWNSSSSEEQNQLRHKYINKGTNWENWCADFASYVLIEAGYNYTGTAGNQRVAVAAPSYFINGFTDQLEYHVNDGNYTPQPGDLFFIKNGDPYYGGLHVGIVYSVSSDGVITSIEGNTSPSPPGTIHKNNGIGLYDGRTVAAFVHPKGVAGKLKTYQLTSTELHHLANLAKQEQGSMQGIAAEASIMANLYEENGTSEQSLYSYVKNSGWFAHSQSYMSDNSPTVASQEEVEIVSKVLVEGYRTLPAYIDEHDYMGDISSVTNNGTAIDKNDRASYIKNTSIIKNVMGSTYTFYSFPAEGSDPFGYKSESRRTELGECHYEYETWTPIEC